VRRAERDEEVEARDAWVLWWLLVLALGDGGGGVVGSARKGVKSDCSEGRFLVRGGVLLLAPRLPLWLAGREKDRPDMAISYVFLDACGERCCG
jgi:hypothetical protein